MGKTFHYVAADGMRGLACLIVLVTHAVVIFFNSTFVKFAGTPKIGVWLFFVLSAFLLTAKFSVTGFSVRSIMVYGIGRAIRILPIFFLVACLYYLLGTAQINTPLDLMNAVTLKEGFAHLWTVPVEFKFYVWLPFIAFILLRAKHYGGDVSVFLAAAGLILLQQWCWPYWETVENTVSARWYASCFTLGCYFAASYDFYRLRVTPRVATGIGVCVGVLMVLSSPYMRNVLFDMPMDNWLKNKFVYLSLLWGVFVVALADGKGWVGALLQSAIMKKLGAWSFSIYLVHWYFYIGFGARHPNSMLWMFIGIACAVIVGAFLHYVVEAPIEKFRHALQHRLWPVSVATP